MNNEFFAVRALKDTLKKGRPFALDHAAKRKLLFLFPDNARISVVVGYSQEGRSSP